MNPGPLAPEARIILLDHEADTEVWKLIVPALGHTLPSVSNIRPYFLISVRLFKKVLIATPTQLEIVKMMFYNCISPLFPIAQLLSD